MSDTDGCGVPAVHIHNHVAPDPRLDELLHLLRRRDSRLNEVSAKTDALMEMVMSLVDDFRADIAELKGARESMQESFRVIREKLDAALADDADQAAFKAAVQSIRDELHTESGALADLAVANTEAAPAPAPTPEPTPEPAPVPVVDPAPEPAPADPNAPTA